LAFGVAAGTGGAAQTVSSGDAAAMIYPPKTAEVELLPSDALKKKEGKVVGMVAADQPYYAAIAISPDEGLMSEATVAAANYHDTGSASAAALAECNAKKKGAADCVIVALVRPEGWQAQPVQLSSDAAAGFAEAGGGAVAISAATGSWGIGADEGAALAACGERNPAAGDCAVVIAP
jgi:citrate lyase gamma subunit